MNKEDTVGTIIQARQQSYEAYHSRWDRLERAARFDQYRALQAQGNSPSEHCLPQCGIKPIVSDSRKY